MVKETNSNRDLSTIWAFFDNLIVNSKYSFLDSPLFTQSKYIVSRYSISS